MKSGFNVERVSDLEAKYKAKILGENPKAYAGRARYIARLHHLIELADGKIKVHWLSSKNAKMHKFLVFAAIGNGIIRDITFDMVMTEEFRFGQATMGDGNCGAVTPDRFEFQHQLEYHIKETILGLTGQEVEIQ